jgi:hypothetical protein
MTVSEVAIASAIVFAIGFCFALMKKPLLITIRKLLTKDEYDNQ